ncbi:MAG: diguanylate cyclase [Paracoccaceae bacterium]
MVGRILIADNVATNRIVMKVKLASAFYEVVQAASGADTLRMARDGAPDLIILDALLNTAGGLDLCRSLRADPVTAHIPILIVSGTVTRAARLDALRAGADEILCKPLDELTLFARVRSLLRARAQSEDLRRRRHSAVELGLSEAAPRFTGPERLAIVARDTEDAIAWRERLRGHLRDRIDIMPEARVLETLHAGTHTPDAFVITADLAQTGGGLRLLAELRSRASTRDSVVIVVHEAHDRDGAIMALDLGASDLILRGFEPEELALRLRSQLRRKRESDRLRSTVEAGYRLAGIDPLTGLYNRRYALPQLRAIAQRAASTGQPYAIMLIDIDRFKRVNDTYGHAVGDTVLSEVAHRIHASLRASDLAARIGGEEFLVVMPDTTLAEAEAAAERLRAFVDRTPVCIGTNRARIPVTLSIGVSMGICGAVPHSVEQIMECADRALFGAKAEGRNQVSVGLPAA